MLVFFYLYHNNVRALAIIYHSSTNQLTSNANVNSQMCRDHGDQH